MNLSQHVFFRRHELAGRRLSDNWNQFRFKACCSPPTHSEAPRPGPAFDVAFLFEQIKVSKNGSGGAYTEKAPEILNGGREAVADEPSA
jgi:hypothetical protein